MKSAPRYLAVAALSLTLAALPLTSRAGQTTPAPGQSTPVPAQANPVVGQSARDKLLSSLTPDQRDAVNLMIQDYLANNPKALLDSITRAEIAAKAEADKAAKTALVDRREELESDPTSPVMGNPKGDVTVVEFFDYRCPYCKASAPILSELLAQDKKVRLVLKEFPILGKDSVFASRVALVAQQHGKYAEFHEAMFALKGPVDENSTLTVAKSVGLDPETVKKEAESSDIDAILRHNYDLAKAVAADGTPAFVIGDNMSAGAITMDSFKMQIAAARAKLKS